MPRNPVRHHARKLFTPNGRDGYGPSVSNQRYTVEAHGLIYDVSRHRWTLPTAGWGWRALARGTPPPNGKEAVPTRLYGDTLGDIAYKLGIVPDAWLDMVD